MSCLLSPDYLYLDQGLVSYLVFIRECYFTVLCYMCVFSTSAQYGFVTEVVLASWLLFVGQQQHPLNVPRLQSRNP